MTSFNRGYEAPVDAVFPIPKDQNHSAQGCEATLGMEQPIAQP
jgi:hypothetical protein